MTSGSAALGHVRDRVDRALQAFLGEQREVLLAAGQDLLPVTESISGLLAGGKRMRPAFCYWGWRGAGGRDCPEIFRAAASLELLHAGALIHDDLMDASDTRRGQPSLHRQFEVRHAQGRWHGSPAAFGMGAAILMGDLLLCWTDEMFHASGLPGEAIGSGGQGIGAVTSHGRLSAIRVGRCALSATFSRYRKAAGPVEGVGPTDGN